MLSRAKTGKKLNVLKKLRRLGDNKPEAANDQCTFSVYNTLDIPELYRAQFNC